MTMVVVARLLDLPQAQVAASALRGAGLHPVLLDETLSYAYWTAMFAFGGCRVAVPDAEVADAAAILDQLSQLRTEALPEEDRIAPLSLGWRLAAGVLGLGLLSPQLGWLVLGVRSRRHGAGGGAMGFALAAIGSTVLLALAWMTITLISDLANPRAFY
jgi:hypothetical protein